jgi:hypothetical protein
MTGRVSCGPGGRTQYLVPQVVLVLLLLTLATTAYAGNPKAKPFLTEISQEWTQVEPAEGFTYNGLAPSCSDCPFCTSGDFYFFVKGGPVNNLVIYLQGGGACWDSVNCLYPELATYYPQISTTTSGLTNAHGIFDLSNPENPFADWNFVFIPSCTGDVHWGSNDYEYPPDTRFGTEPWTIRHRGFVNFMAVMSWITDHFSNPHSIFVAGSSAGAYGALIAFPYVVEAYPKSRVTLLGDAGNGVITENFIDVVPEVWGADPNIPSWIPGIPSAPPYPLTIIPDMYKSVGEYYDHLKISQFTTAYDNIQTYFYNVMLNIDTPGATPADVNAVWNDIVPVWCDWHEGMLENAAISVQAQNYRYYIAAGDIHTILGSDGVYTEDSAGGVRFVGWLDALIRNQGGTRGHGAMPWMNLECTECDEPPVISCSGP